MSTRTFVRSIAAAAAVGLMFSGIGSAWAQLQITEILNDPLGANDNAWEWVEVRNLGGSEVDLNGYLISRLNDEEFGTPSISTTNAVNTKIPAGGVAVLYDGQLTGAGDFNDSLFRTAWGLAPTVPLIAVNNFGLGLTNGGGTAIGFWPDLTAYSMDLSNTDADPELEVTSLANATFSIDYRTTNMFPAVPSGTSIRWSGNGSYQDGTQWAATTTGTTSVVASLPGNTNSTADTGSPGIYPTGTAPAGITFTEIMYNPTSNEPQWEWVEVFNNTGSAIDFGATPYVFDDNDDSALTAANVTSGVIPTGKGAVLFNAGVGGVTLTDMQAAWDKGQEPIFIPVSNFTALAQGGDQLALWPSLAAYQSEAVTTSPGRTMANAAATVTYDNEAVEDETGITGTWPNDNGAGSIRLLDFGNDRTIGESWGLSTTIDGFSFSANGIAGTITVHAGGELGTPGAFSVAAATDADFDNDNDVDGNDFLIWQRNLGTGTTNATGDADNSGSVTGADLAIWKSKFGGPPAVAAVGAVPEPATALLTGLAVAACGLTGRARRRS